MFEKPVVMPVVIGDDAKSIARKIRSTTPSLPAGTIVRVEVED